LISACEDRGWNRETQQPRSFHVGDQFEPARLRHRQVGGLGSLEGAIDQKGQPPHGIEEGRTIRQKPAALCRYSRAPPALAENLPPRSGCLPTLRPRSNQYVGHSPVAARVLRAATRSPCCRA